MLNDKIKFVKMLMYKLSCKVVIGGSTAMYLHGIDKTHNDLDIILINPTVEDSKAVEFITEMCGGVINRSVEPFSEVCDGVDVTVMNGTTDTSYKPAADYQFNHPAGFKVDMFKGMDHTVYLAYEGVLVNPVSEIIRAKKEFGRPKDLKSILNLVSTISKM